MSYLQATSLEFVKEENFPVVDSATIGRQPFCEVVLDHGAVSREHARITHLQNCGYFLEDLNSRNGTCLNGRMVHTKVRIFDGDRIRICDVEFVFHGDTPDAFAPNADEFHHSSVAKIIIEDDPKDETYNVTSQIQIPPQKGQMNPANAEIKLHALIDIGRNLGANLEEVLPQLLENLLKIFRQADCAYFLLNDPATKRLELKAFKHRNPQNQESFRISRSVLERVATNKAAILSDDIGNDSRFGPSESIVNYHIHSVMAAPVMNTEQDECLGVIQVDSRSSGKKFNYNDLDLLASVAYQVAVAVENTRLHEAKMHEKIMEHELEVAHKVQRGLLPVSHPEIPNYDFFDFYQPARYLGGDYYDYIPLPNGEIAIALGDVSGKGISAALFVAKLSTEVRYGLLIEPTLGGAMMRLNKSFCESRWENRFITFFLAVLNPKTNIVRFLNAGHFSPLLVDPHDKPQIIAEQIGSLPLGILPETSYEEYSFELKQGQVFVTLSDGLTDAMNSNSELFGLQGILNHLESVKNMPVDQMGRSLVSAVKSFAGKTPQNDDQCLVLFGRQPNS